MLVFKCSKCGEIYRKNEVTNDEICTSCGSYLKVVNINDDVNPEGYHMNDNLSSGVKSNVGRIRTESSQTRTLESGLNYRNEPAIININHHAQKLKIMKKKNIEIGIQ